jgi:hypothetical protein
MQQVNEIFLRESQQIIKLSQHNEEQINSVIATIAPLYHQGSIITTDNVPILVGSIKQELVNSRALIEVVNSNLGIIAYVGDPPKPEDVKSAIVTLQEEANDAKSLRSGLDNALIKFQIVDSEMSDYDEQFSKIIQKYEESTASNFEKGNQLAIFTDNIDLYANQLQISRSEDRRETLKAIVEKYQTISSLNSKKEQQIVVFEQNAKQALATIEQSRQENSLLQTQIEKKSNELVALQSDMDYALKQKEEANKGLIVMKDIEIDQVKQLLQLQKENNNQALVLLQEEIKSKEEVVNDQGKKLALLQDSKSLVDSEIVKYQNQVQVLIETNQALLVEKERKEEEYKQTLELMKVSGSGTASDVNNQLSVINEENDKLLAQISELKRNVFTKETQLTLFAEKEKKLIQDLQVAIDDKKEETGKLTVLVDDNKGKLVESLKAITQLDVEKRALEISKNNLMESLENTKKDLQESQSSLLKLMNADGEKDKKIKELEAQQLSLLPTSCPTTSYSKAADFYQYIVEAGNTFAYFKDDKGYIQNASGRMIVQQPEKMHEAIEKLILLYNDELEDKDRVKANYEERLKKKEKELADKEEARFELELKLISQPATQTPVLNSISNVKQLIDVDKFALERFRENIRSKVNTDQPLMKMSNDEIVAEVGNLSLLNTLFNNNNRNMIIEASYDQSKNSIQMREDNNASLQSQTNQPRWKHIKDNFSLVEKNRIQNELDQLVDHIKIVEKNKNSKAITGGNTTNTGGGNGVVITNTTTTTTTSTTKNPIMIVPFGSRITSQSIVTSETLKERNKIRSMNKEKVRQNKRGKYSGLLKVYSWNTLVSIVHVKNVYVIKVGGNESKCVIDFMNLPKLSYEENASLDLNHIHRHGEIYIILTSLVNKSKTFSFRVNYDVDYAVDQPYNSLSVAWFNDDNGPLLSLYHLNKSATIKMDMIVLRDPHPTPI